MADLVSITLPIFLLIGLGFAAVKLGVVGPDFIRSFGTFVINFAMPSLILHALLSQDLGATFSAGFLAAYAAGSLAVALIAGLTFRYALRRPVATAAMAALGSGVSNSGFVGLPIALMAVGAPALVALPMALLVELALVIPLSLGVAEMATGTAVGRIAIVREAVLRLARMPVFAALIVGIVISLSGLAVPVAIGRTIDLLANAATACALFTVGGNLAAVRRATVSGDLGWIVVAKLVLHPLAVAAALWMVGDVPPGLAAAGIILAACPMLSAYPIFAQRFGLAEITAATLLATTVVSFVTLTLVVGLVR